MTLKSEHYLSSAALPHELKLIILDRDGVINHNDRRFIRSPEAFIPIQGSYQAIAKLHQAGIYVAVATNQSGIARGYYNESILQQIHEKMRKGVEHAGGNIASIHFCPHLHESCTCRKPKPGMLNDIMKELNIMPQHTIMVGDSLRDIQAGQRANCQRSFWVETGLTAPLVQDPNAQHIFPNLASLVDALCAMR